MPLLRLLGALLCLLIGAGFLTVAFFFALRDNLVFLLFNSFWGLLFVASAFLLARESLGWVTKTLAPYLPRLCTWAPALGSLVALGFALTAIFWLRQGSQLMALVNLFWAAMFLAAGFMLKYFGLRRTAALVFIFGGGLYTAAASLWLEWSSRGLAIVNIFWGVVFLLVGLALDRTRQIQSSKK